MWPNGKYNNIPCRAERYDDEPGYICEMQVSKFMIMLKLYVIPRKISHYEKKLGCMRTLILKRVTRVHVFFLDCSTISSNSENDDIFIQGTTRP